MEKNEYQLVTERLVLHPWREWEADQVRILPVATGKKRYLPLLLIGDEQESMIDRYLDRGEMFVMRNREDKPVAIAVVTDEGDGILDPTERLWQENDRVFMRTLQTPLPHHACRHRRQHENFIFLQELRLQLLAYRSRLFHKEL